MPAPTGARGRVPCLMTEGDGGQGPGASALCPQWGTWGRAQVLIAVWGLTAAWAPPPRGVCGGGTWRAVLQCYLFIC